MAGQPAGTEAIAWDQIEGLPGDQPGGEHGLNSDLAVELPPVVVYEAGLALEGILKDEVPLGAVVPITRLQTRGEIAKWEAEEARKAAVAARRGVSLRGEAIELSILGGTTDPAPEAYEAPRADEVEVSEVVRAQAAGTTEPQIQRVAPGVQGVKMAGLPRLPRLRTTAKERAEADAALHKDNTQINHRTKRILL